jgi:hypothetical protein
MVVDARRIAILCKSGSSSKGTVQRALHSLPKNYLRCVSAMVADSHNKTPDLRKWTAV